MKTKKQSTRAEQARERRTNSQQKKQGKVSRARDRKQKQHVSQIYATPTLVRGLNSDLPLRKKAASQTRRRVNISLGSPGAEIRLPSVPMANPGWRVLSWVLLIALATGFFYLWSAPTFRVGDLSLDGANYVTAREVSLVLGIKQDSVFTLNPPTLARELMLAFPVFASVDVQVSWPNQVTIVVAERTPVLVWQHANGILWVDADGVSYPAPRVLDTLPMVLAPQMVLTPGNAQSGEASPINIQQAYQLLSPDSVAAVLQLQAQAPADAALLFDSEYGFGWQAAQGWAAYFGENLDDIDEKLIVYNALVNYLETEEITPQMVSVEYVNAPYYRMDR